MLSLAEHAEPMSRLGVALAVGLIVGFERGWATHRPQKAGGSGVNDAEGLTLSGIRTFALMGLLGGVLALVAARTSPLLLLAATAIVGALAVAGYVVTTRASHDPGITTEVALVLTFALGLAAGTGYRLEAVAAAVMATMLLGFKAELHASLARLSRREMQAALQMLVVVAVVLPLLPDRALGPWQSLNPHVLGWMVTLIAGVEFVGYFAARVLGARAGMLLTAVLGGLTSSTAVTIAYARLARLDHKHAALSGAGIAIACGTMVPRLMVEIAVTHAALLPLLLPGLAALMLVPVLAAIWAVWRFGRTGDTDTIGIDNPLELRKALLFGVVLSLIFMASHAAEAIFGSRGVLVLAALSGIADVDAITLALAAQAKGALAPEVAARGILLAALTNTAVKATIAGIVGGRRLARWTTTYLLTAVAVAALALLWI